MRSLSTKSLNGWSSLSQRDSGMASDDLQPIWQRRYSCRHPQNREKKRWCGFCSLKGEGHRLIKSLGFPAIKIPLIWNICLIESFYFIVRIKAKGHLHEYYYFTYLVRDLAPDSNLCLTHGWLFVSTITLKDEPHSCLSINMMKHWLVLAKYTVIIEFNLMPFLRGLDL